MSNNNIVMSSLNKTWIFDLDGTLVKHNGYKIDGYDTLLSGVKEFFESIPKDDLVIIITSRTDEYMDATIAFLKGKGINYDHIIFNAPFGERILINDKKASGLKMSFAFDLERNKFLDNRIIIDESL